MPASIKERTKRINKASIWGIVGNVFLVAFKLAVGMASNSIAVILDAVNNLTDALSSVLTIVGTKMANEQPDKEHPYGHGRIEYLTTMVIAFIILAAGLLSLKESIDKIIHPEESSFTVMGLVIITVAILVKIVMGAYMKREGRRWESDALYASGVDAAYDAIITGVTLAASLLVYFGGVDLQGYVGALIGFFIIRASFQILKDMYNQILGIRADDTLITGIKELVHSFKPVSGVYDLVLNSYGPNQTIGSVHITLPEDMKVRDVHLLCHKISTAVYEKYHILMTIGVYAENKPNMKVFEMKRVLDGIISTHPHVVQIHAFYVDEETKTIFYDLITDFDAENPMGTVNQIQAEFHKIYPDYKQVVTRDIDFSN